MAWLSTGVVAGNEFGKEGRRQILGSHVERFYVEEMMGFNLYFRMIILVVVFFFF